MIKYLIIFFLTINTTTFAKVTSISSPDSIWKPGTCINGDCRNGNGTFEWPNGSKYVGEWNDGNAHGQGIYYYNGRGTYEGEWQDGLKHGYGKRQRKNKVYSGEWQHNKKHGQGTRVWNGVKYTGEWKNNSEHGKGIKTFENGTECSGHWSEGIQGGYGTLIFENQLKYKGELKNCEMHGDGTFIFSDGGSYDATIYDGKIIAWKDNSQSNSFNWSLLIGLGFGIMNDSITDTGNLSNSNVFTKVCKYTCGGSVYSITVGSTDICPINPPCDSTANLDDTNIDTGSILCFKESENQGGNNKVCNYNCPSGPHAITIGAAEMCPISVKR